MFPFFVFSETKMKALQRTTSSLLDHGLIFFGRFGFFGFGFAFRLCSTSRRLLLLDGWFRFDFVRLIVINGQRTVERTVVGTVTRTLPHRNILTRVVLAWIVLGQIAIVMIVCPIIQIHIKISRPNRRMLLIRLGTMQEIYVRMIRRLTRFLVIINMLWWDKRTMNGKQVFSLIDLW